MSRIRHYVFMTSRTYKTIMITYVIVPFIAAIAAMVLLWNSYIFATDLYLLLIFQTLSVLGITIGYHRMLTHDGFKTFWPIRAFFTMCGCMALEGKPLAWVATHVKHHAHSDMEEDPHSPLEGVWHAHMGWLFSQDNFEDPKVYCPELTKDSIVMFFEKTYFVWVLGSFAICYAVGGLTGFIWGGLVRVFLTTHITWSVNSICHTFGGRDFETTDESRNNWIVGLLAFGEGWHNNHHAFPRNVFHGMRWYQFDLSGIILRGLEKTKLIWKVQRVGQPLLDAQRVKSKSMQEKLAGLRLDLIDRIDDAREELIAMQKKLPPKQLAQYRRAQEKTLKRLTEIQLYLDKRKTIRKASMVRRQNEVALLITTAKAKMQGVAHA